MIRIIEQSHKEKVKMYMKIAKSKLIEMLINCNNILDRKPITYLSGDILKTNPPYKCHKCGCKYFNYFSIGGLKCVDCGRLYGHE